MKKTILALAAVAALASCKPKPQQPLMVAAAESDSIFMVNDSTVGDLQTFYYEGFIPSDSGYIEQVQLIIQSLAEATPGTYSLTASHTAAQGGQLSNSDAGSTLIIVGIPGDSTAVVYELVSYNPARPHLSLMSEGDSLLSKVGRDFKKVSNDARHKLRRKAKPGK